jgi:hypothetical protein
MNASIAFPSERQCRYTRIPWCEAVWTGWLPSDLYRYTGFPCSSVANCTSSSQSPARSHTSFGRRQSSRFGLLRSSRGPGTWDSICTWFRPCSRIRSREASKGGCVPCLCLGPVRSLTPWRQPLLDPIIYRIFIEIYLLTDRQFLLGALPESSFGSE